MIYYIRCAVAGPVILFNGAVELTLDDRLQLTQTQFGDSSVTAAITAGDLQLLEAQADMVKIRGNYPPTIGDKQLTEGENVSVDTTLGNVRIDLIPNPIAGSCHEIVPIAGTWNDDGHHVFVWAGTNNFRGDSDPYELDLSFPILFVFIDEDYGWEVIPLS